VSRHVVAGYVRQSAGDQAGRDPLTPRQREILCHIAEGRTTKEIARILNISVKTVETHRTQLMERLDIHDVAGLVRYALRTGLIAADG
jgi:DNA-binding CsgD family transcriptional regulator